MLFSGTYFSASGTTTSLVFSVKIRVTFLICSISKYWHTAHPSIAISLNSILTECPAMSHRFHRNTSLCGISIPCQCITSATFFKLYLICCCSVAQSCLTLCDPMKCSTPGSLFFTISQSLLKLMSIESVMPSNHLTLCHPLLLLPSNFASIRVFSHQLVPRIRWPKYWSFSISSNQ